MTDPPAKVKVVTGAWSRPQAMGQYSFRTHYDTNILFMPNPLSQVLTIKLRAIARAGVHYQFGGRHNHMSTILRKQSFPHPIRSYDTNTLLATMQSSVGDNDDSDDDDDDSTGNPPSLLDPDDNSNASASSEESDSLADVPHLEPITPGDDYFGSNPQSGEPVPGRITFRSYAVPVRPRLQCSNVGVSNPQGG